MTVVRECVSERAIRALSCKDGIDSKRVGWGDHHHRYVPYACEPSSVSCRLPVPIVRSMLFKNKKNGQCPTGQRGHHGLALKRSSSHLESPHLPTLLSSSKPSALEACTFDAYIQCRVLSRRRVHGLWRADSSSPADSARRIHSSPCAVPRRSSGHVYTYAYKVV